MIKDLFSALTGKGKTYTTSGGLQSVARTALMAGVVLTVLVQNNKFRRMISFNSIGYVRKDSTMMKKVKGAWNKMIFGMDAGVPIPIVEGKDVYDSYHSGRQSFYYDRQ